MKSVLKLPFIICVESKISNYCLSILYNYYGNNLTIQCIKKEYQLLNCLLLETGTKRYKEIAL